MTNGHNWKDHPESQAAKRHRERREENPPRAAVVKGGQGREPEELLDDAGSIVWVFGLGIAALLVYLVIRWAA